MKKGFTLIELLVVVAIISLLSSVVMASLNGARSKGRDTKRIGDLKSLQTALELYRSSNTGYPSTGGSSSWRGLCPNYNGSGTWTNTGANGYIPGLAPTYISVLPQDPKPVLPHGCYLYTSDGRDYMILAYFTVENTPIPASIYRPLEPGNPSYAVYTAGASGW